MSDPMPTISLSLLLLAGILVTAVATAAYAWVANHRRQALVGRTMAGTDAARARRSALLTVDGERKEKLSARLLRRFPSLRVEDSRYGERLAQAGYDGPAAPAIYATSRVVSMIVLPSLAVLLIPTESMGLRVLFGFGWLLVGWVLPRAVLARAVRLCQERVRRALPDALDLLVVCVEAGISIDAAILRVARELQLPYPDLGKELMIVNRKTNAGITREEALRGLWTRTGVEELRTLSSSLIQSEKWGTSVTKVLRVSAHTFRRKRRQTAEKRVALAPVKMTFPLVTMIMPAMFIIILGPAILQLIESLRGVGQ
jgi:tight adherence protein C